MRVLHLRRELYFTLESGETDGRGHLCGENLYDDLAVELDLAGNEHSRHSAAAELALDSEPITQRLLKLFRERGQSVLLGQAIAYCCVTSLPCAFTTSLNSSGFSSGSSRNSRENFALFCSFPTRSRSCSRT